MCDKLYVILENENLIRSSLEDLRAMTGGGHLWLIGSPHYLRRVSDRLRASFDRVLEQADFSVDALTERVSAELGEWQPRVRFLTDDESSEQACCELQVRFGESVWSVERLLPFVNKMASKSVLGPAGIRLPRHQLWDKARFASERGVYCREIADAIGFPMIVKPIDRAASIDVSRLENMTDLYRWANWSASPKDRNIYEVDEFIDGDLYHCDSLIQNGQVIWSNACRNLNPCLDFAAGRSIGAFNLPVDDPDAVAVRALNANVLAALDPPDGATHMECFRLRSGELVFLEISARPPGGDMVGIYRYCFGIDLALAHFVLRAQEPYRLELNEQTRFAGWALHPHRQGRVRAVRVPSFRSEYELRLTVAVGDVIDASSQHIVDRPAAEFWLYSDDYDRVAEDCQVISRLQLCEVEA
jgi:hypothetical protein